MLGSSVVAMNTHSSSSHWWRENVHVVVLVRLTVRGLLEGPGEVSIATIDGAVSGGTAGVVRRTRPAAFLRYSPSRSELTSAHSNLHGPRRRERAVSTANRISCVAILPLHSSPTWSDSNEFFLPTRRNAWDLGFFLS